ncbi:LuxR C-terminal-related transcriptional regulator [Nocardia sp. NPDC004860]|uniref:LuxR C-terminal-related transcriptional regulator n=1 Tax=Nocardia sp. NPDC004860 TaxID=3154557 RepID=UPI0033A4DB2A
MPQASWISAADDEMLAERMQDLFLRATDLIGIESEPDIPLPGHARLAHLRGRLEDFVNAAEIAAERRAEGYELLVAIHQVQNTGLEAALAHQLSTLSEIRGSIDELSALSPRELIDAAPARACRDLSVGRAMISTISGSIWLPQHLHIENRTAASAAFEEFVDGARIPLSDAPLETELLIRRRTAALVPDPVSDKRTYKQIVDAAGTQAYVAAPITVRGRTIGMLHADRPADPASLTHDDLELATTFAECLSILFESAILRDRMEQQVRRATDSYVQVVSMLHDVDGATFAASPPDSVRRPSRYSHGAPAGLASLTGREREVLAHLATGATNLQIARNLRISQGTVKSHLKQIAKKLGTSSRAAAVAAFARMTSGPCEFAL